jgi:predicted negative regulator of RcsB-dependent stress response
VALIAPSLSFPPFFMSDNLTNSTVPLAEISQAPSAFDAFLDRNQKNLVVVAVLLVLAAVAFVVYRGIEKNSQETAGNAFAKADDLASLQAVVTEHPKTTAASSAQVLLADKQWLDGKKDASIATLQKFIAENPTHLARPSAKASLASKLLGEGKTAEASQQFEQLTTDADAAFIAPFAYISLGDIAKAAGDLTKAEATYKKVQANFPDSRFVEDAGRRLANLKVKPPLEIEPPPAPATPAAPPAAGGALAPTITPVPQP